MSKLGPTKVGSQEWLQTEQKLVLNMVFDEVEDFAFAARRELEWLNEHMLEMSKGVNVAALFQTPRKLVNATSPVKMRLKLLNKNQDNLEKENMGPQGYATTSPVKVAAIKSMASSPAKPKPVESQENSSFLAITKSIRPSADTEAKHATDAIPEAKPKSKSTADANPESDHRIKTDTAASESSAANISSEKRISIPSDTPQTFSEMQDNSSNSPAGFVSLPTRVPLAKKSSSKSISSLTDKSDKSFVSAHQLSPHEDTNAPADMSSPFQEIIDRPINDKAQSASSNKDVPTEPSSFMENLIRKASRLLSGNEPTPRPPPNATTESSAERIQASSSSSSTATASVSSTRSPQKKAVLSRLMAPTFSSASRINANPGSAADTYNTGSPRPVQRNLVGSPVKYAEANGTKSPRKPQDSSIPKFTSLAAPGHSSAAPTHKAGLTTSTPGRGTSPTRNSVSIQKVEPRVGTKLTSQSLQPRKPKIQALGTTNASKISVPKDELQINTPSVKTAAVHNVLQNTSHMSSDIPRVGPGRPLLKTSLSKSSRNDDKTVSSTSINSSLSVSNSIKPKTQRPLKPAAAVSVPRHTLKRPSEPETPLQHKAKQPKLANSQGPSNLVKAALLGHAKMNWSGAPMAEGVKFSNDKLKFGKPATAAAVSSEVNAAFSTPVQSNSLKVKININAARQQQQQQQQQFHNMHAVPVEDISLPEIMSESEDDEDGSVLQDWANSPELRDILARQQLVNPDTIFGPIRPLNMEEVFTKSKRLSKLRPRSSSANWNGHDRLTQKEIEEYAKEMGYNS